MDLNAEPFIIIVNKTYILKHYQTKVNLHIELSEKFY